VPEISATPASPAKGLRLAARSALLWNSLPAAFSLAAQVLQFAWLARALPPDAFGSMAIAGIFLWFGQGMADLGLTLALIQKPELQKPTIHAAYTASLCFSIALALSIGAVAFFWGTAFFHSPDLPLLMPWLLPCLPLHALTMVAQAGLQRELRFKVLGLTEAMATLSGLAGAWIGLKVFGDARALALSLLLAGLCRAALALTFTPWRLRLYWLWSHLRPLYPFAGYQILERALNFFVGHLDKIILGRLLGSTALGFYQVAFQLALRPSTLLTPIAQRTAMPLFSRLQNEPNRLGPAFLQATRLIAHLAAPIHLIGAALAAPLLRLILGPEWENAVPIFQALCVLGFLNTAGQPSDALLPALGRADASLKLNIAAVIINFTCAWTGSYFGGAGVALALVLGNLFLLIPYDGYLRRRTLGLGLIPWLAALFRPIAINLSAAGFAYAGSNFILQGKPFTTIPAPTALGALALGIGLGLPAWALLIRLFAGKAWQEFRELWLPQSPALDA